MYAVIGMQLLSNKFYYCNFPSSDETSEDAHISTKMDYLFLILFFYWKYTSIRDVCNFGSRNLYKNKRRIM